MKIIHLIHMNHGNQLPKLGEIREKNTGQVIFIKFS